MDKKYDFTQFIRIHTKDIFGRDTTRLGIPIVKKYRNQIHALDIKMNEAIIKKEITDKIFILGLFDLTLSQFSVSLSTRMDHYKTSFFDFLDNNDLPRK